MKIEDFTEDAPGDLVSIPANEGGIAFVPQPLPPDLNLDRPMLRLLAEASNALGRLDEAVLNLPKPGLVVTTFVRSEAVASSRIEGTITTLEQLTLFNSGAGRVSDPDSAREADNYKQALELGIKLLAGLPPSLRLLKNVHERLMTGVRGAQRRPGEFRTSQNFIAEHESDSLETARFVPPPAVQLGDCLDAFEKYMNGKREYPELVELALIHYQFETIHPFEDGNGRIGRLLVALLTHHWKLLEHPVLRISPFFERRRLQYMDALLGVSQRGDWNTWIRLFLTAVRDQAFDSAKKARQLFELRESYRVAVMARSRSNTALEIVDGLFEMPVVWPEWVKLNQDVTAMTAGRSIDILVAGGILKETTGKARNRLYVAEGIYEVLHAT
ncbi:MAG: Fic family protein [Chloroflexi bacterium]|nr:Fic family protein [Chloroflexota bacterium]